MNTLIHPSVTTTSARKFARRSIPDLLAPLDRLAKTSPHIVAESVGRFEADGESYEIPRYIFVGNRGSEEPIRVGVFGGIHGDEPEGVHAIIQLLQLFTARPELAAGFCVYFYPICNPTGFEDNSCLSRRGKDLNREFWKNSDEPEVKILQAELFAQRFNGIIALHTDEESHGVYGFVRGATLAEHLLGPALNQVAEILSVNSDEQIDGFHARDGMIGDCYDGVLGGPPRVRPRPFEIIVETPGLVPVYLRELALVSVVHSVLAEYRKFIAYAPNL